MRARSPKASAGESGGHFAATDWLTLSGQSMCCVWRHLCPRTKRKTHIYQNILLVGSRSLHPLSPTTCDCETHHFNGGPPSQDTAKGGKNVGNQNSEVYRNRGQASRIAEARTRRRRGIGSRRYSRSSLSSRGRLQGGREGLDDGRGNGQLPLGAV